MFYDEMWYLLKRFEDSGLSNAECVGVMEMLKNEFIQHAHKNAAKN